MSDPLRLGIAGLGTVGTGVLRIVQSHAEMLAQRAGRAVEIAAVSARSRGKDRGVDLSAYGWEDDPVALARRDDVDLFVELMGGEDGPAKASVEAAIAAGKHVVTANKAMLAIHGQAMAEAAEDAGVALRFEAAVAGAIPCIKALTEGLAGNRIRRVMGVMNGTCNYILTRMESAHLSYDAVFIAYMELRNLEPANFAEVEALRRSYEDALEAILKAGQAGGDFAIADTKLATMALIAMLTGVNTWYREGGRLGREQVARAYADMALGAVGCPRRGA